jgi:hypothetical protein
MHFLKKYTYKIETSTRKYFGGKRRPVHNADNLTTIYEPTDYKMWEPRRLNALCTFPGLSQGLLNFFLICYLKKTVAWVRERTLPTERPPLEGEVSANFCG